MASASADAYFARPVYLPMDRGTIQTDTSADIPKNYRKDAIKRIRFADVENIATHEFSDVDNSSPPPCPPPPRSICATMYSQYAVSHRDRQNDAIPLNHRTNELRRRDNNNISTETPFITRGLPLVSTQTMAARLYNYNTVDITDCVSDHGNPTVGTMVMMTTEEERGNQEKTNHSLDKYMSIKVKSDKRDTNKSKASIQNKANLHVQFLDSNTFDTNYLLIQNGAMEEQLYNRPKVVPRHIKTESKTRHSWLSSENPPVKTNSDQDSPVDSPDDGYATNDSPDDGYGLKDSPDERYDTNSSRIGTVLSPFSSSSGSTDLDYSVNGYSKRINLPNGAIKPNSVRESWAVKRKQRLIESHDNTVQEQLRRELNVIEEEENATKNTNMSQDKNFYEDGLVLSSENIPTSNESSQGNLNYEVPFIDVSQNDLQRINTQFVIMDGGRGTNNVSKEGNDEMFQANHQVDCNGIEQSLSTNEIEGIAKKTNNGSENKLHQTGNRIEKNIRAGGSIRAKRSLTTEQSSRLEGNTKTEPASWDNGHEISGQNNVNRGHFLPQTGNEQYSYATNDSGNIYIRPSGNERLCSLNQSRSTSIASLQAIIELTKSRGGILGTDNVPSSPLEELRVDLLEKWSDKDRNYRNYYGFDEQGDRYSRTDSKVNYFQEKKINTLSGRDSYYQPHTYGADTQTGIQTSSQIIMKDSSDNNTPNHERKTSSSHVDSKRSKNLEKDTSVKSILFKMLPNMFKPSSMKHNTDTNDKRDTKNMKKADRAIMELPQEARCDSDAEAEYINLGDLPQYSLANVECEEKLMKGHFSSLEHLHRKPVFASSRDIKNLFSNHDKTLDSLNGPGRQRNSFHAMPLSYRHTVSPSSVCSHVRPRTVSINVSSTRGQEIRNAVEDRVLSFKNAAVLNRARQVQSNADFAESTPAGTMVQTTSRTRLDRDSYGGECKLSTLV